MSDQVLPEADCIDGASHPRMTNQLRGHDAAERAFLDAYVGQHLHHAWLITGPRGVGKASLAWRVARFLLSQANVPANSGLLNDAPTAPDTLDVSPETPVSRRISALSEPGLMLIRRAWDADKKRLKAQITVDEVRKLGGFFGLSSADGGQRVVIIDSVDEANASAANALLKVLEEPPRKSTLLLISHAPARLLPTVRSRCRELRLSTLADSDLDAALVQAGLEGEISPALRMIANGSVGEAIRLRTNDGPELYRLIVELLSNCPNMDRSRALSFAESVAQRGKDQRLDAALYLIDLVLSRLARTGAGLTPEKEAAPGEIAILGKLSPSPIAARKWAGLQQEVSARTGHGRAVNVDPQSLVLDALLKINEAARHS